MSNHFYHGFWCSVYPVMESTESRVKRGDWRSLVIGYRYTVRYQGKVCFRVGEDELSLLTSVDHAFEDFENRIDAIRDSL